MRAVLDPNVLISALLSRSGTPARLLQAWRDGRFELVVSAALLGELERALTYPKLRRRIARERAVAFVGWLSASTTTVCDPERQPRVRSRNSSDDHLLALAAGERAVLVTGDEHLLELADELPIYSAARFVELLATR